jgi:hypothetical protein
MEIIDVFDNMELLIKFLKENCNVNDVVEDTHKCLKIVIY